ncbi:MAG TPA: prepilin-type N-terminal cleavage/methylation domain-containing protein [Candidatus Levybacteria bacterium]|nr:prepilin-type N-terminal cleavage/methylation domain-containing protein [Candidatus Levybacteria bacterium]
MKFSLPTSNKGFTLVELLVVIAVLGVLAAGVLVAINPLEQFARGSDTGRKSSITELGRATVAYYTAQGQYFATSNSWITTNLKSTGEVKITPNNTYPTGIGCNTAANRENNYCYATATVAGNIEAIVYARLESGSDRARAGCTTAQGVYFVYSTLLGQAGYICTTNATTDPSASLTSLVN